MYIIRCLITYLNYSYEQYQMCCYSLLVVELIVVWDGDWQAGRVHLWGGTKGSPSAASDIWHVLPCTRQFVHKEPVTYIRYKTAAPGHQYMVVNKPPFHSFLPSSWCIKLDSLQRNVTQEGKHITWYHSLLMIVLHLYISNGNFLFCNVFETYSILEEIIFVEDVYSQFEVKNQPHSGSINKVWAGLESLDLSVCRWALSLAKKATTH